VRAALESPEPSAGVTTTDEGVPCAKREFVRGFAHDRLLARRRAEVSAESDRNRLEPEHVEL